MTAQSIADEIDAIVKNVGLPYSAWTIGITEDSARRFGEHDSPAAWRQWPSDTPQGARNVEAFFLRKGMQGGSGGLGEPRFVYIF